MPKVSIACRCYNHSHTLKNTITSVLNQTFSDWELIIVDDNSTDNSVDIIRSFSDSRIKLYVNDRNLGVVGNLNRCISLCTGEYIAILDADDMFAPDKLQVQVDFLDSNPEYGAVFSYVSFLTDETTNPKELEYVEKLINTPSGNRAEMLRKFFLRENFLAFPTEMFRREFAIKFPENLIAMGDCNFHIQTLMKTNIKVIEQPLTIYNMQNMDQHVSTWTSFYVHKIEGVYVYSSFCKMTDLALFCDVFSGLYEGFGIPTSRAIPYFIARILLDDPDRELFGLCLFSKIFNNDTYLQYIMKNFDFTYADFLRLRRGRDKAPVIEYKRLFGIPFIKVKYAKGCTKKYFLGIQYSVSKPKQ